MSEQENLEKPLGKDFANLMNDLDQLTNLARKMAFVNEEISLEQRFVWRSVRRIADRALNTLKRVAYLKKEVK